MVFVEVLMWLLLFTGTMKLCQWCKPTTVTAADGPSRTTVLSARQLTPKPLQATTSLTCSLYLHNSIHEWKNVCSLSAISMTTKLARFRQTKPRLTNILPTHKAIVHSEIYYLQIAHQQTSDAFAARNTCSAWRMMTNPQLRQAVCITSSAICISPNLMYVLMPSYIIACHSRNYIAG